MRIISILLFAFASLHGVEQEVNYCAMMGRAESTAVAEIEQQYGLSCVARGGGGMCLVRTFYLLFQHDKALNLEESRKLSVRCCEKFLKIVNSYKQLRPYLIEYPYPIERLQLSCHVSSDLISAHKDFEITGVTVVLGNLLYKQGLDLRAPTKTVFKEPYIEAKRIVLEKVGEGDKQTGEQIILGKEPSGIIYKGKDYDTPRYTGSAHERRMSWEIDRYGVLVAKHYGMKFHMFGNFSDSNEVMYGLTFFDSHEKTLSEAQPFARKLVADYLRALRVNQVVLEYHAIKTKQQRCMRYPPFISDEIAPCQLGVKIGYWNNEYNRPKKPAIAQIEFREGKFRYYEADPETDALVLVLEEPFEEKELPVAGLEPTPSCPE